MAGLVPAMTNKSHREPRQARLCRRAALLYEGRQRGGRLAGWKTREDVMTGTLQRVFGALAALVLTTGLAAAKVTIAVGGAGCLCYLPTILAQQLGEYQKAGVEVEIVNFKGGSQSLTAVLGGSADVVSGYYDHCVNLAAKNQAMQAFVVYDRFPGLVLVVSPKQTGKINSVKDLAGKKVGVTAPGSSTDFFLKYLLSKAGVDANSVGVVGVGLDATAVAAQEQGMVDAAVMLDPAVSLLQNKYKDVKILSDTRSQHDTLQVFGGEYPGGALYTRAEWIASHEKETQQLTNAIMATLKWIHSHSAEEIMAKMPADMVGADKALYLAALKNTIPMYSTTGRMDPKGAEAVLAVFSQSVPEIAKAKIDLSKTYTNKFVEQADKAM
jgi:NitT/TauT family transport system substrate-binding protein